MRTANLKKAWVRSDGSVVVREKESKFNTSIPMIEKSVVNRSVPQSNKRASQSEIKHVESVSGLPDQGKSMRKVQSANMIANNSKNVSKKQFSVCSRDNSVSRRTTSAAWCPGHVHGKLFDTEPYTSVIHPKEFLPAPIKRFSTRSLLKNPNQDFLRYVAKMNRPFMITGNQHFIEKPPRTFYNHINAQHDFFKKDLDKRLISNQHINTKQSIKSSADVKFQ